VKTKTRRRRRGLWLVDMLDGTWTVACKRCGLLGRGPKALADATAKRHVCR
jgi:hypothetical protein